MTAASSRLVRVVRERLRTNGDWNINDWKDVARALAVLVEHLEDRAVCSGCGNDVNESGACSYPGCDDGEMIPASELPLALREMRDRRDEWRQEAMSL